MCKVVEEDSNGDQVMPQVGSKMMEEVMEVMEAIGAMGGAMLPCWWGSVSLSNKYTGTWPYQPTRPR
jgi:hypothetical protein